MSPVRAAAPASASPLFARANRAGAGPRDGLRISTPGDAWEQEAERVAESAVNDRPGSGFSPSSAGGAAVPPPIQRMCASCASEGGGQEEEEDEESSAAGAGGIHRQAAGAAAPAGGGTGAAAGSPRDGSPLGALPLGRGGEVLPSALRAQLEPQLGHDFGHVRMHRDAAAAAAARSVGALAFTTGRDLVFGEGQFRPDTRAGRRLIAHELAHGVQQERAGSVGIQRTAAPGHEAMSGAAATTDAERGPEAGPAAAFIAEDDAAELATGQMRKADFLAQLRDETCRAANGELAAVGRSTEGCPWLDGIFTRYAQRTAPELERSLRRYAPEARQAESARGYFPYVAARVRQSARRWAETGEISGLPEGAEADMAGMGGLGAGLLGGLGAIGRGLLGGLGRLLFKHGAGATSGGPPVAAAAVPLAPAGEPLETGVRGRMESAFGHDFSGVRVHRDGNAAALASRYDARAFTVGSHIAFGRGEYQPGNPAGDALVAHELAHVVQQSGSAHGPARAALDTAPDRGAEEDADRAAAGATAGLWGRAAGGLARLSGKVAPALRSGLRLQRCASTAPKGLFSPEQMPNAAQLAADDKQRAASQKRFAANPDTYDPDFFPEVSVRFAREEYRFDFSLSKAAVVSRCDPGKRGVHALGCVEPNTASSYDFGVDLDPKREQRVGSGAQAPNVTSPLGVKLREFPVAPTMVMPKETVATDDNTFNHELVHLFDFFIILQLHKMILARRVRDRLIEARKKVVADPAGWQGYIGQKAIDKLAGDEAGIVGAELQKERTRRDNIVDEQDLWPQPSVPTLWTTFKMPPRTPGTTGSFEKLPDKPANTGGQKSGPADDKAATP